MAFFKPKQHAPSSTQAAVTLSNGTSLPLAQLLNARFSHSPQHQRSNSVLGPWLGPFRSQRRGHGLDFDDMRPYQHGDDVRHIDWKATARHNDVYTRMYKEEKEHVVTLAVDFTSSMFTGSEQLKSVNAGLLAAKLAWHISNAGARCGIHIQSDDNAVQLPAANAEQSVIAICAALQKQFEQAQHARKAASIDFNSKAVEAQISQIDRMINGGRTLGVIILIGGIDNFNATLKLKLSQLSKARSMAVLYISDPIELTAVPVGRYRYRTEKGVASIHIGKSQQQLIQENLQQQQNALDDFFGHQNMLLIRNTASEIALLNTLAYHGLIP